MIVTDHKLLKVGVMSTKVLLDKVGNARKQVVSKH